MKGFIIRITQVSTVILLLGMLVASLPPQIAFAANTTAAGTLTLVPAFEQVSVYANFNGDDNSNATAYVEYRTTGGSWIRAMDLWPDRRDQLAEYDEDISGPRWTTNPYKNQFRGIIFGLTTRTVYEVRVIIVDPDGVTGSPVTGSVTTRDDNPPSNGPTKSATPSTLSSVLAGAQPGDIISLEPGTYTGGIDISVSGQPNNYITIQSADMNNKAIISGGGFNVRLMGSYIRLRGLNLRNPTGDPGPNIAVGWDSGNPATGNIIEQNVMSDPPGANWGSAGILLRNSMNTLIQDNVIQTTGAGVRGQSFGIFAWGTGAAGGGNVIRRNNITSEGCFRDGMGNAGNFQITAGYGPNTMVYGNYIYGSYDDGLEMDGGNMNTAVFDNIIKNNNRSDDASMVNGISFAPVVVGPLYVVRNTIIKPREGDLKVGASSYGAAFIYHNTTYMAHYHHFTSGNNRIAENQHLRNNIVYASSGRVVANYNSAGGNDTYDYDDLYDSVSFKAFLYSDPNSYSSLAALRSGTGQEMHGISADPKFVNPSSGVFTLQATSPAIDVGLLIPGINSTQSPWPYRGSAPDMGAFEYDSGAPSNSPPVLNAIGNKSVTAGQLLQFTISATDPNGDTLTYSASNLPSGATFNTSTRVFSWTPASGQVGSYPSVHFQVSDGTLTDTEDITITVNAANSPPVLSSIGNRSVVAGQLLQFTISATDPNGDTLTYSASTMPQGASFNASIRTFSWTPTSGQVGTYPSVHFQVSDGSLTDTEDITITVNAATPPPNSPPVLNSIGNKSVTAGQLLQFTISATDPNGDTLTYSASNLPQGASFNASIRAFSWTPTSGQVGTYPSVHFQVSDGTLTDTEDITITVNAATPPPNSPPVLNSIGNKSVTVGQLLQFTISATDPNGDALTYSASNLPSGASFNTTTRVFSWTPTSGQVGTYPSVHFQVSDGSLTDTEDITITVNAANSPPVLNSIGNKSVTAGQLLQFTISATDPNGNTLTYSASNLPSGASFNTTTRVFSWTPASGQVGTYPSVHFQVSDGSLTDTEDITITVNAATPPLSGGGGAPSNSPPVLNPIGDKSVTVGQLLQFTISATDPNGNTLTYSASHLPSGASFDADIQTFSWTPTSGQVGTYPSVHFQVSDGSLIDTEDITITVNAATPPPNSPPVLNLIGNKSVTAGQLLQFTISATDPNGDTLTYSASNLSSGATFNTTTMAFSWTPNVGQYGLYSINFEVTDGALATNENIVVTVEKELTPPEIYDVAVAMTNTSTPMVIRWTTNEPSSSQVEYWASPSKFSPLDTRLVTEHEVQLTGLTPQTTYYYRVMSRDESGNLTISAQHEFTTVSGTPEFAISQLSMTPDNVYAGQEVAISATITNNGDGAGVCEVVLTVDGVIEAIRELDLPTGSQREVTFFVTKDLPGIFAIDLNGSGAYLLVKEVVVPFTVSWATLGTIIIVTFVATVILVLVVVYRRRLMLRDYLEDK